MKGKENLCITEVKTLGPAQREGDHLAVGGLELQPSLEEPSSFQPQEMVTFGEVFVFLNSTTNSSGVE